MEKKKQPDLVPVEFVQEAQTALVEAMRTDPVYSLTPDPLGKLGLSTDEKEFIKAYTAFKNIPYCAHYCGIPEDDAMKIFMNPKCKEEIHRINIALYQRKFTRRLLTIDELGGYLTSVLIDEDIGIADQLNTKDKLQVVKLIMDLNKMKSESYNNPNKIIEYDGLEEDLQDLDVNKIKELIAETKNNSKSSVSDEKSGLIKQILAGQYHEPSDVTALESMSIDELEKMLKTIGEQNEN